MKLLKRLDLWIAEYDKPAYSQIVLLLKDCKTEILNLKYELDVVNENGAGTIQELQAEIQRLERCAYLKTQLYDA